MRYYIIAGEASGDLHGSNLVKYLARIDSNALIRAWGGDKMASEGVEIVKHVKDLAFMGFWEVLVNIKTVFNNISFCKKDIQEFEPDVLILIDYPGFNLRIAEWAKQKGIKVCYYISPQVWAWKANRVKKIKNSVDKMFVILPFEKQFYKKYGIDVEYVGHPLTEIISEALNKPIHWLSKKPIVALLPGSRSQEIKKLLPLMLQVVEHFPKYQFIVAKAPSQSLTFYQEIIGKKSVVISDGDTYNLLKQSNAAIVTSGTATLETALLGVPQVVCYKGNTVSYWLAKRLVKVKYISLVNLILKKQSVKELIQEDCSRNNLVPALYELLNYPEKQELIQLDYTQLWELLGAKKASQIVAKQTHEVAKLNI